MCARLRIQIRKACSGGPRYELTIDALTSREAPFTVGAFIFWPRSTVQAAKVWLFFARGNNEGRCQGERAPLDPFPRLLWLVLAHEQTSPATCIYF